MTATQRNVSVMEIVDQRHPRSKEKGTPPRFCQCGCGTQTNVGKGRHAYYVPEHYTRIALRGDDCVLDEAMGCWLWRHGVGKNYGCLRSAVPGRPRAAHRFYFETFRGRRLAVDEHLHHRCNQPRCVNPDHVEIITAATHGRLHASKLTADDVARIREMSRRGQSQSGIASQFAIDRSTVSRVVNLRHSTDAESR